MKRAFGLVCASAAVSAVVGFSSSRMAVRMSSENYGGPKIVVTGLGTVSSAGVGAHVMFDNLCDGKSALHRLPEWADEYPAQVGSMVSDDDFNVRDWMHPKEARRQARYTHFAIAASRMALEDAKVDLEAVEKEKFGVLIGSGIGGIEYFEDSCVGFHEENGGRAGLKRVSPFLIPALISNTASGIVAIDVGAEGPNFGVVSACATGTHALGTALDFLKRGEADIMIAGGSEAALTPLCFAGFASMKAMVTSYNDDPTKASRPFDKDRAGFVMGEGCGVLVLETEEHAKARGAKIYCEFAGYGATCDAHHITAPHPEGKGLSRAITQAMETGGVEAEDIGYINAHGTSTPYNDKFETMAIKSALGDHAYKTKISSTKSMMGHTLGAAGGLEAVVLAKVLETGKIPPTANLENPDLEAGCDLDYCPGEMQQVDPKSIKAALSDNLGFGGHNAAVLFKQYA
uniref:3-oxoacyl-[acyl-carrier-protein] synthase n=1 Tax=Phaeomonas parva TaxID=124430 RepID=A0A7S1XSM4_9STRA|mmetsp:Transcript_35227/g.110907  ORF Transcript_35227/g.110907 Transcript_35227/m.110907 type:complete len:459 (+) Transcript_35227:232-1608(+)